MSPELCSHVSWCMCWNVCACRLWWWLGVTGYVKVSLCRNVSLSECPVLVSFFGPRTSLALPPLRPVTLPWSLLPPLCPLHSPWCPLPLPSPPPPCPVRFSQVQPETHSPAPRSGLGLCQSSRWPERVRRVSVSIRHSINPPNC